jgi:hypothetical protein
MWNSGNPEPDRTEQQTEIEASLALAATESLDCGILDNPW